MTKSAIAEKNTNIETKEVKKITLSKRELGRKYSILVNLENFKNSLSKKYGSEIAEKIQDALMNHGLNFDDAIEIKKGKNTIVMTRSTNTSVDFAVELVEKNNNVGEFSKTIVSFLEFKDGTKYVYLIRYGNATYTPKKEYKVSSAHKDPNMLPEGINFGYGTKKVFVLKKFASIDAILTIWKFFKEYIISEKPTEVITRKGMTFTHFKSI